jgi:glycosyltransferase involved in cell wall biosynthesis
MTVTAARPKLAAARRSGPAISVIVPTKNERHNLPQMLASLPPDVELLLCDASDDGTPEVALRLRPENTRVLTVEGSIAAARQAGAEACTGDLLVFSDADVVFAPNYFERLVEIFGAPASTPYPFPRGVEGGQMGVAPACPPEPTPPLPSQRGRGLGGGGFSWDAVCGAKLSRGQYAGYYRLVTASQRLTYAATGIAAASGSNMVLTRPAFRALDGFRSDLRCNEDTELFLRAGRRRLRVHFDSRLIVWATDHRRLHRGLVRKSVHSLVRNVLLFVVCKRPGLPRLLVHDWGYWARTGPATSPARRLVR